MTTQQDDDDDDCWNAFGSEEEEEDDDVDESTHIITQCEQGVLWLTQHFVRWNPQIHLVQRRVYTTNAEWKAALDARGMQVVVDGLCDAAILSSEDVPVEVSGSSSILRNVVPGGVVLMTDSTNDLSLPANKSNLNDYVWDPTQVVVSDNIVAILKYPCPINQDSCPWIPSSHSLQAERRLLAEATVTRSALELLNPEIPLTQHDIQRASQCLTHHGYCIVRNLVDPAKCCAWGKAVLHDLDQAARILKARNNIDLRNPTNDSTPHNNYRELAMREDLRMDLRDGPHLRQLRQEESSHYADWDIQGNPSLPIITTSPGSDDFCLRFHSSILEIVKRTMNPKSLDLYRGNFGRYNFEGSGPDGSYQPIRVGPMGGIVSLPGSADQALHADTPHLFEHLDCLPAHYINAFCLGANMPVEKDAHGDATGSSLVGGTALVDGSHRLSFTAAMEDDDNKQGMSEAMLKHLVRPSLQLGDVLLFDCRILHFGLANNSKDVERPMLYVNMTHAWFHDPKNWDDRQQIFDKLQ